MMALAVLCCSAATRLAAHDRDPPGKYGKSVEERRVTVEEQSAAAEDGCQG